MVADLTTTPLSLDDETLEPPKSRVGTVDGMIERIGKMKEDDRIRSERRTKQQGLIDGNRPYNQGQLDANGQGDRTNLNLREGEGMADAAKTSYYPLVFGVPQFAGLQLDYGDDTQRRTEWSTKTSASFHTMITGWSGHDTNVQLKQWQMVVFGVGNTVWEDTENPFWKARKASEVLIPDGAEADIEMLEECALPRKINPVELYRKVAGKSSEDRGWFPERVKRAIVELAPDGIREAYGELWSEHYQESLRRGDVRWNTKNIPIVDYLVKEFNGKITHCILLDTTVNTVNPEEDDRLLFKKTDRFDEFCQVMCPFFFDVGTGEWHSVKGLGPKIYDYCEVSNRLTGDMIDGARNGACLLMSAADSNAVEQSQLITLGPGVRVIGPGLTLQQNRIADSLQGPLAIKRDLQNTLQSNVGQYRQRPSNENMEPTLGQAQLNFQQQGQLADSSVARYMKRLDAQYREMLRRALKTGLRLYKRYEDREDVSSLMWWEQLALRFIQDCVKEQVPLEALDMKHVRSVRATRGIGNGSPVSSEIATRSLLELVPMMDERGRRNALRARTASIVGQGNVDAFFPPFDEQQLPDDHTALATLENNALRVPQGQVIITPRQDHVIHFKVHYEDAAKNLQGVQQGGNPMQVLVHLHQAGPHMKAHLDAMQGDPTREQQLEPMEKAWMNLARMTDQLQQQVQEAMQAQQKAQQEAQPKADPAMVSALAKTQGELEIKRMKAKGDMALKAEKQQFTHHIKDLSTASDIQRKDREQMASNMIEDRS